ncbi:MAG: hypothetical protein HAW66_00995 [Shewanella sp.]|nr:hypothetical protein [Shewanella sp.]
MNCPDHLIVLVPELAKFKLSLVENKQAFEALNELTLSSVEQSQRRLKDLRYLAQLFPNNESQFLVKIRNLYSKLELTVSQKNELAQKFEQDQKSNIKDAKEKLALLHERTQELSKPLLKTLLMSEH